jgi:hypothetical protein
MRCTKLEISHSPCGQVNAVVYARHGRELMRLKSSVREPCCLILRLAKVLAEGKRLRLAMASQEGVTVRWGLKEAGVQNCEPTNRNGI